ncbi:MAG: toll/interleukin-1 receptor domain-containing protein [Chloroflexota bacterium]
MNKPKAIFIAYRQNISHATASHIYKNLLQFGFSNVIDGGKFTNLATLSIGWNAMEWEAVRRVDMNLGVISRDTIAPKQVWLVLILEPGTLDGCVNAEDLLMYDIKRALNSGCTILTLVNPRFAIEDYDKFLPADIADEILNGALVIRLLEGYFTDMMHMLTDFSVGYDKTTIDIALGSISELGGHYTKRTEIVANQPTPQKSEVFVSYSRKDWIDYAEPLVTHLRSQGLNVWVDQHLLEGGDDWLDRINEALERCYCLVLCVSPEALSSKYAKMEYRYFMRENKPIVPIICQEAKLPAELGGIHYLPFSDLPAIVQRLKKLQD